MQLVSIQTRAMLIRRHFSSASWFGTGLRGRILRRACITFIFLILSVSTGTRVYSFVLTHKIQAVISGLSKLQIDQTTEEEVRKAVPYIVRSKWEWQVKRTPEAGDVDLGEEGSYYVTISNEWSWMKFGGFAASFSSVRYSKDGRPKSWVLDAANLLGYRYMAFGARVELLNGKVTSISYGIADNLVFPRELGTIVSVKSVHGFWAPYQRGFEVRSTEDESPQFRINGSEHHLDVLYTFDAPSTMTSRAFKVDLSCFWGLLGCNHAREIAPLLWQEKLAIETATLARLKSNEPCPIRILAGRVRYLPDTSVLLLESTGFKTKSVNEDGMRVDEVWTNYKPIEVPRGWSSESWESVRSTSTVPDPEDYNRKLPNTGLRWANAGVRVLAFTNLSFDSCRLVVGTPSALSAIRNTARAPRRREDETICCPM